MSGVGCYCLSLCQISPVQVRILPHALPVHCGSVGGSPIRQTHYFSRSPTPHFHGMRTSSQEPARTDFVLPHRWYQRGYVSDMRHVTTHYSGVRAVNVMRMRGPKLVGRSHCFARRQPGKKVETISMVGSELVCLWHKRLHPVVHVEAS